MIYERTDPNTTLEFSKRHLLLYLERYYGKMAVWDINSIRPNRE